MKRSLAAAVFFWSATVHADSSTVAPLRHDLAVDVPVTFGLLAGVVGWRLVRDDLEPSHCRLCDGASPSDVNAVDRWFRDALKHSDSYPANFASYILAFGAAPLGAVGFTALAATIDHASSGILVDTLAIAEGGLSAMAVTQFLEPVVLRTRPYVLAIPDDQERNAEIAKTGAFHSFPSGHVTVAFGAGVASGVVASMRGYRWAPLVWASGLLLGVATAYTRVASDRHYVSDTVVGALVGSAVGAGVPYFFHRPIEVQGARVHVTAAPVDRGSMIGVGGTF